MLGQQVPIQPARVLHVTSPCQTAEISPCRISEKGSEIIEMVKCMSSRFMAGCLPWLGLIDFYICFIQYVCIAVRILDPSYLGFYSIAVSIIRRDERGW